MSSPSTPRSRAGRAALAWAGLALVYLAATLWMTRPLLFHARSAIAGPPGDNLAYLWILDWYHTAIVNGLPLFHTPVLNAPEGWNLAYNEINLASVVGFPGYWLGGGAALAYNLRFWLTFVLSGLFTAFWVRRLTGRLAPGAVAGMLFAFLPYRLAHAYGHLDLLGTEALPLYVLCLTELLRGGRVWWSVGAALAAAALAATCEYYLYMTALISLPLGAVLLASEPGWHRDPRRWRNIAVCAAVAGPLVTAIVWPYLQLVGTGHFTPHALSAVSMWSASPTDFLLPAPVNSLMGDWVNVNFDRHLWIENTLTPGLIGIVLAVVGWRSAKRLDPATRLIVRTITVGIVVAFVLALGTDLHWLGNRVLIPVPDRLQPYVRWTAIPIPLPGFVLFKYLPFYGGMRVWMRWGVFVDLFVCVLAGVGFDRLTRDRPARVVWLVTSVTCLLVLVEFGLRPYPLTEVKGRPVDVWLAAQGDQGPVIQLPASELAEPQHLAYTIFHRHPYVGGPFSPFPSPQFLRIEPSLRTFPSAASVQTMKELGVRWAILDLARYPEPQKMLGEASALGLEPVGNFDGQFVFRVPSASFR